MLTAAGDVDKKWCPFVRVEGHNRINNSLTDGFENTPSRIIALATNA
jgi:hypothetical protein